MFSQSYCVFHIGRCTKSYFDKVRTVIIIFKKMNELYLIIPIHLINSNSNSSLLYSKLLMVNINFRIGKIMRPMNVCHAHFNDRPLHYCTVLFCTLLYSALFRAVPVDYFLLVAVLYSRNNLAKLCPRLLFLHSE